MVAESIVREAEQSLHDARSELNAGLEAIVEAAGITEDEIYDLTEEIERIQTLVDQQSRQHDDDPEPERV